MKTGLLTFHGSSNPGAFWQAYATCQLLKRLGHTPVVIDYYNPFRHKRSHCANLRYLAAWKRPELSALVVAQRIAAASSRKQLPLSTPIMNLDDLSSHSYDAIIIGSDVVWESPIDPVYLGSGTQAPRLIAYAVSAGGSNAEKTILPPLMHRRCPFHAISVRDRNTLRLLERAGWAEHAKMISDPTITLDVPPEYLRRPTKNRYLLVYCSNRPPSDIVASIRRYARERGLRTIAVFYPQRWVHKNVFFLTAQRWMSYLAKAECVVTNTFHGAVLSCLFNKRLAVVNLSAKTVLKTQQQFEILGINKRVVFNAHSLSNTLDSPWNKALLSKISFLAEKNVGFIKNSLE